MFLWNIKLNTNHLSGYILAVCEIRVIFLGILSDRAISRLKVFRSFPTGMGAQIMAQIRTKKNLPTMRKALKPFNRYKDDDGIAHRPAKAQ